MVSSNRKIGVNHLDLADYLLIAEAVLRVPAEALKDVIDLGLAESALAAPQASYGGVEFYPEPAVKAAILCSRLVQNHPARDGNKRLGLVAMLEFVERNGLVWEPPPGGPDEIADVIERLAGREPRLSEPDFIVWVKRFVRAA